MRAINTLKDASVILTSMLLAAVLAACGPAAMSPSTATPVIPTATATSTSAPTATATATPSPTLTPMPSPTATPTATPTPLHPLAIAALRQGAYPGSEIVIEEELTPGVNYDRYLTSYRSEGLKIYALLTAPRGEMPDDGWPVIVFNHGYIPPEQYRTTERYVAYVDGFARNGYIVFRPDYRGHGFSEGEARGAYGAPDYTIDVLNAVAALKRYPQADPARIGMWGHSMGGSIALQVMVATDDVRAGVIWAGMVGTYPEILTWFERRFSDRPTPTPDPDGGGEGVWSLVEAYGRPEENPEFWDAISATSYLADLSGPIQLHHGTADSSVPFEWSEALIARLEAAGIEAEFYAYENDNHNLSNYFGTAMARSVEFFDAYLK